MNKYKSRLSYHLLSLCVLLFVSEASAQSRFRTVITSGQPVPGTSPGIVFAKNYDEIAIDPNGRVTFLSGISGAGTNASNNYGLWSDASGNLALVARESGLMPGLAATESLKEFVDFNYNSVGSPAFVARISPNDGMGMWVPQNGQLELVARSGEQAPGLEPGTTLESPRITVFHNSSGKMAMIWNTSIYKHAGIWTKSPGEPLSLVAQSFEPAPGAPNGAVFYLGDFSNAYPVISESGKIAFRALTDTSASGPQGIWIKEPSSNLSLLVYKDMQAPDAPIGATFFSFSSPIIDSAGNVAFRATMNAGSGGVITGGGGNDDAIWFGPTNAMKIVAREGFQAPGAPNGAVFNFFSTGPMVNGDGYILLENNLQTGYGGVTDKSNAGLWAGKVDSFNLVIREGDPAPIFTGKFIGDFSGYSMNSHGKIVVITGLRNTPTGGNAAASEVLWGQDSQGEWQALCKSGDLFEVGPGDFRTISNIDFNDFNSVTDIFNDNYVVAFQLTFTDNSSGIFTVAVPEPSSFILIGVIGLATAMLYRRKRIG